jgi:ankyrin repeat protein
MRIGYIPYRPRSQIAPCAAQQASAELHRPMEEAMFVRKYVLAALLLFMVGAQALARAAESDLSINAQLLLAARNSDVAGVERTLKSGASVDSRNRLGETALLIALKKKDLVVAKAMIDAGTDPNIAAVNGVTPLMAAAHEGLPEIVVALLARGADPRAVDRIGKNAIVYAAGEGHAEVVGQLLARGIDPNAVYRNDLTALMWAAGYGRNAAVKTLLAAGARADLRDNRGKTALDIAREGDFGETAALLQGQR